MQITGVTDGGGATLEWSLGPKHEAFGSPLAVTVGTATDQVCVSYTTNVGAPALQWLKPAMTAGKKSPFVFTQCQAIHARSLVPCQDTPQVKQTYDATVTVPTGIVPVMSALGNGAWLHSRLSEALTPSVRTRLFSTQKCTKSR
jgi:aminopeptidase N